MTEQHALARLIESAKEANSWTNADLERTARQHGHAVSRSNISRILTQDVKTVVPSQVQMLADATGLPIEMVTLAALKSTGLSVAFDSIDVETAVRRDAHLSEEAKSAILALVASYRKSSRKSQARPGNVSALKQRRRPAPERGRPYLLDEAAREDTGQPTPGEVEDNE